MLFILTGSMRAQLHYQIADFRSDKFTFVTWDQPGYGQSRPPARIFNDDSMSEDTELLVQFMNVYFFLFPIINTIS